MKADPSDEEKDSFLPERVIERERKEKRETVTFFKPS